jgi:hypothetical protein
LQSFFWGGIAKELNKELNVDVKNNFLQSRIHTEHSWGCSLAIFQFPVSLFLSAGLMKKREKINKNLNIAALAV